MSADFNDAGNTWSKILADRSPSGRAVVLQLEQAEQTCAEAKHRVSVAIDKGRLSRSDFTAFETAAAEVNRMRREVYRMARQ